MISLHNWEQNSKYVSTYFVKKSNINCCEHVIEYNFEYLLNIKTLKIKYE